MADKNGSGSKPDVEKLRAEIRQTRAELGETVQALAARADVKARARAEVEQAKLRVRAQAAEATGKVREAAHVATDRVRHATAAARSSVERVNAPGTGSRGRAAEQLRRAPIPLTAVLVAAAAVIGVILVVRGRRR